MPNSCAKVSVNSIDRLFTCWCPISSHRFSLTTLLFKASQRAALQTKKTMKSLGHGQDTLSRTIIAKYRVEYLHFLSAIFNSTKNS